MIIAAPALWLPPEKPAIVRVHDLAGLPSWQEMRRRDRALCEGVFPFPFFPPRTSILSPPPANLWGWWSAEYAYTETSGTPSTLITSDGTAIGSLKDLSGNGHHAYQATAGNKPTYKTGIKNGCPAVLFTSASAKYIATTGVPTLQPTTLFVVVNLTTWATAKAVFSTEAMSPAFGLFTYSSANNFAQYNGGFGTTFENGTGWHLIYSRINGSSGTARIDNNSNTSSSLAAGGTGSTIQLGGNTSNSFYYDDYICEWLFYNADYSDPTSGDALLARQYLNSKYALGLGI
jgi:hypothetical protein